MCTRRASKCTTSRFLPTSAGPPPASCALREHMAHLSLRHAFVLPAVTRALQASSILLRRHHILLQHGLCVEPDRSL